MNVCIVGSGPTAEGKGRLIDACDFVVRLKRFWSDGAEHAGSSCHAIADYDYPEERCGWPNAECWITQTPRQLMYNHGIAYLENFGARHGLGIIRWMSHRFWLEVETALGYHPSTGFVAICMAMRLFKPDTLTVVGFDQLTPEDPNFHCARREITPAQCVEPSHNFVAEKRCLAELEDGTWLREECHTRLVWIGKPEIPPIEDAE